MVGDVENLVLIYMLGKGRTERGRLFIRIIQLRLQDRTRRLHISVVKYEMTGFY